MFKHKCERKLTGQHNHYSACGEYFNSDYAFDKHRVGEFGADRRCATVEEMTLAGMSKNADDWWITSVYTRPHLTREANKPSSENLAANGPATETAS